MNREESKKRRWENIIPDVTENKEAEGSSSTGYIVRPLYTAVQSLYTLAYGNAAHSNKTYASLDEAIAANDLLGATKLYLSLDGNINLTPQQREFLKDTWACSAIEYQRLGEKRSASLPRNCTKEVLDAFLYVLQHTGSMAELCIHSYQEKESNIIRALKAFSTVKTVKSMYLDGADIITINIAKAFAELLFHNNTLQTIYVGWNMCDTLPYLTHAMQENTTVKELRIERSPPYSDAEEDVHPSLSADDLIAFARMLATNSKIEKVSLRGANIPDNVAQAFAEAFSKNHTLTSIDLSECRISAEGLQMLAETWLSKKELGALKTIHLSGNDPRGADHLSKIQGKYKNLDIYYDTGRRCCGQRQYEALPKPSMKLNSLMNN